MNNKLDDFMYESGLIAQGCWDELDDYAKQAIERYGKLIAEECVRLCEQGTDTQMTSSGAAQLIKLKFGL
jgi:predicted metal-dependent phosphotriesterase family hydrolase